MAKMKEANILGRKQRDGAWSIKKRETFLAHLAVTCNVRASVRAVGMSETGLYKLRQRDAGFRAAWAEALAEGYDRLEMMALERALGGTPTPIIYGGRQTGEVQMPDNSMVLKLLQMHRTSVKGGSAVMIADPEAACVRLREKLAEMHDRMTEGAAAEAG
ncbi:hypothetical protein ACFB49_46480 [Sphingomonas sp. DBB INV C78]|uniref:hypothetical protein n=1 Tax=Sphingomonas sp. DBB INV C78 TaxID=3349434 RepID=UPI0036D2AE58